MTLPSVDIRALQVRFGAVEAVRLVVDDHRLGALRTLNDYFPFGGRYARDYLAHDVEVAENTKLAEIFGAGSLRVNSMHHQGVHRVGRQLVASAVAPDGLVEGLESGDSSYLVAVQWHPEALTDNCPRTRRLFESFVAASSSFREQRALTSAL